MAPNLELPVVDLSSDDRVSTAEAVRLACLEHGFFYLVNHGIGREVLGKVFEESKKFFSLPAGEKMGLRFNEGFRGYIPVFAEKLPPVSGSLHSKGNMRESFYIGSLGGNEAQSFQNQWPSEEVLPCWRETMVSCYEKVLDVGIKLVHLIALALDLDENYFEKIGALSAPPAGLRLLHYPGHVVDSENSSYGVSAHSDYGMLTLLACDGVPGLQICREKDKHPNVWEDVPHLEGAFVVNVGDMLERWTNCLFRSTLHRVITNGQERYSMAFFLNPNFDCLVECLDSCCTETNPPRFPPVRSCEYLIERFKIAYV